MIKRSVGRSAVAAAAYRSGERLANKWDGRTHDYTHKGDWKNHREDTTDWNNRENAEKWRAAWAAYVNRALEAAGRPERIDHHSYERQGIEKIPTIHMGVAASQMERRGIQTEKGNVNRQIAAGNKLLKEIKARITRLYNWTKEQTTVGTPPGWRQSCGLAL